MKRCTKCGIVKPVEGFYTYTRGRGGLVASCKDCCNARSRAVRDAHKKADLGKYLERERERAKRYREANRDKINRRRREVAPEIKKKRNEKDYERIRKQPPEAQAERRRLMRERARRRRASMTPEERSALNKKQSLLRKERRKKNPEEQRRRDRLKRQKRLDSVRKSSREWAKNNPDWARLYKHKRRAIRKHAEVGDSAELREYFEFIRTNPPCAMCGESHDKTQVDHIIPLSRGGAHSIENLQPSCVACNFGKNNKLPTEYRAYRENHNLPCVGDWGLDGNDGGMYSNERQRLPLFDIL